MDYAQKLDFDFLLEDLLKCESEVEKLLNIVSSYQEVRKFQNLRFVKGILMTAGWERAILRQKAKEKYNV